MNYVAILDDGQRAVQLDEQAPGQYRVSIDGRSYDIDARMDADGRRLSMLLGQRSYAAQLWQDGSCCTVAAAGMQRRVEVLDLRHAHLRQARSRAHSAGGRHAVVAPMPGKVVATLVAVGDVVKEGQGLGGHRGHEDGK